MKLIIQIPCFNEAETLPATLADLPRQIDGVMEIEYQVIDDGSTDATVAVARSLGVHHIISFKHNRGLAAAFKAGVDHALVQGADILVNTDGDNQYCGHDIPRLVEPILRGQADVAIGCRPIDDHPEFSWVKKQLQKAGSWFLRKISGSAAQDASSGFRAYSQEALLHLNVFSSFSYCMETLIQSGYQNLKTVSVPIRVNRRTRESRLFRNIFHYLWKSGKTIVSVLLVYRSSQFFTTLASTTFLVAVALVVRYLALVHLWGAPSGMFWPSVVLAGCLLILSVQLYLTGVVASLIGTNRKLAEETIYRLRRMDLSSQRGVPTPIDAESKECAE
jgi:glycosyltransferase involved in cell wall biosynthesis